MKIVLVNKFHYLKGGSETYYFGLAEGLKAAGHEVHFFAMEGDNNLPCEDADLFVSAKDYNGPSSLTQKVSAAASLFYSKEAREKFQALCERVQPDVVHMNLVHRQITLSILDAPYLKEHGVPVLFTAHDYILVSPAISCSTVEETSAMPAWAASSQTASSAGALRALRLKVLWPFLRLNILG